MARDNGDTSTEDRTGGRAEADAGPVGAAGTQEAEAADAVKPERNGPEGSAAGEEATSSPKVEVGGGTDSLADAQQRIATLEQEKAELKDRMLRIAADFDNFKKRSRKEMAEAEPRGREALLKELFPVIDNLERAIEHASAAENATVGGLLEGVRMVLRQFLAALEKFEVRQFSALGEAFDPQFHMAVQQIETADSPAGKVVQEYQKGYRSGDRLLRPAMVAVAARPRSAPTEGAAAEGEARPAADGEPAGPGTADGGAGRTEDGADAAGR